MPYSIDESHPECEGFAVVKDTDGSVMGCHRTRTQAERQIAALYASEDDMDDDPEELDEERAEGHTPSGAMIDEARRGLEWRDEYNRGGTAVGVARARDISNGRALSLETVVRMRSYFARHEVDKQGTGWSPGEDGYPSAGRIAWALWGGDAGRAWANRIVEASETRIAGGEPAIISDIDGTLIDGDRVNEALVERLNSSDAEIYVVTGRPITRLAATVDLLDEIGLDYEELYMNRGANDVAHKRATAQRILEEYDVLYAVENDEAARRAYDDLGIRTEKPTFPDTRSAYDQAVAILARLRAKK
jgi:hypothetical protein